MQENEFGQPAGDPIPGWKSATRPGGQVLVGRTVQLEPLTPAHADPLHSTLARAPESHWTYMPWGPFADAEAYLQWVQGSVQSDDVEYLVIHTPNGESVGVAGYMNIVPEMGLIEVGGITYAPQLQGTTHATEAMYLMMAHAFDDLGYRRYEWKCDSLNGPSRAAAERLGFVYEGTFANHRVVKGRNRDTAWFAVTIERWRHSVGPALRQWLAPDNFDSSGTQRHRLQDVRNARG